MIDNKFQPRNKEKTMYFENADLNQIFCRTNFSRQNVWSDIILVTSPKFSH